MIDGSLFFITLGDIVRLSMLAITIVFFGCYIGYLWVKERIHKRKKNKGE